MGIFDYAIIVIYMVAMVLIGFYFKSNTSDAADYIVAGRNLGISVFIATYLATAIGGGVLNGWVGTVYSSGLSLVPSMIVLYIFTAIIGLVLAPKLRKFGGFTAPDVLARSYDRQSQAIGGVFSFIYLLGTGPAMQTITFGTILNVITGIPFVWGCVISMAIILFYTYSSGLWGVVMTDYIQFLIMGFGVAIGAFFTYRGVGGWEGILQNVPQDHLAISADYTTILKLIVTTALPIMIDGTRYQRFYACKDEKTAKKGTLLSIIPMHIFYMLILLMGTCAYVLLPNIKADATFSTLLLHYLPAGIRGIVFAALLAAIMSTCDSYLLVSATNFSNDIYKNLINPGASDEKIVKITRTSILVIGLVGLGMAIWLQSIMSAWSLASAAYVGGCFIPMMYALFFDKARKSKLAAKLAMLAGGVTGAVLEIIGITPLGLPAAVIGALVNLVIFVPVTLLDKNAEVRMLIKD